MQRTISFELWLRGLWFWVVWGLGVQGLGPGFRTCGNLNNRADENKGTVCPRLRVTQSSGLKRNFMIKKRSPKP